MAQGISYQYVAVALARVSIAQKRSYDGESCITHKSARDSLSSFPDTHFSNGIGCSQSLAPIKHPAMAQPRTTTTLPLSPLPDHTNHVSHIAAFSLSIINMRRKLNGKLVIIDDFFVAERSCSEIFKKRTTAGVSAPTVILRRKELEAPQGGMAKGGGLRVPCDSRAILQRRVSELDSASTRAIWRGAALTCSGRCRDIPRRF